jgi:hypothetical protein
VKRFVLTSSSIATYTPAKGTRQVLTEKSWNEDVVRAAWAEPPYESSRGLAVYGASKVQGEQALWKWVEENKPEMVVNTGVPSFHIRSASSLAHITASFTQLDFRKRPGPTKSGVCQLFGAF